MRFPPFTRKVVVAALLPRAYPIVTGFAGTAIDSLFLAPIRGSERIPDALVGEARSLGIAVSYDAFGFAAHDDASIVAEARYRLACVRGMPAYRAAVDALPPGERGTLPAHLERTFVDTTANTIAMVDALDDLTTRAEICGVVVSEEATSTTRSITRWARARGIPSVVLVHGASAWRQQSSADFQADDYYFYGWHAAPTMIDGGVEPSQLHLGTFYGHADHATDAAERVEANRRFRRRHAIGDDDVVVTLATGFQSFSSGFEADGTHWFFPIVVAFAEAVALLRRRGIACAPVIKHRWGDAGLTDRIRRLSADLGVDLRYDDGPIAAVLPATDILIGSESNTMLEAELYDGVVIADLVLPWHWHVGPAFGRRYAIPYADARSPEAIASLLDPLVRDPERRAGIAASQRTFRPDIIAHPGGDVRRIARDLLAILDARRSTLRPARAPRPAPVDAIRVMPPAERVLDLTGAAETRALLLAAGSTAVDDDLHAPHDAAIAGYAVARAADTAGMLRTIRDALLPDGRIVVQFANARHLRYLNDLCSGRPWSGARIGRDSTAVPMTLDDIVALLSACGFTVETAYPLMDPSLSALASVADGAPLHVGDLTIPAPTDNERLTFQTIAYTVCARRTG